MIQFGYGLWKIVNISADRAGVNVDTIHNPAQFHQNGATNLKLFTLPSCRQLVQLSSRWSMANQESDTRACFCVPATRTEYIMNGKSTFLTTGTTNATLHTIECRCANIHLMMTHFLLAGSLSISFYLSLCLSCSLARRVDITCRHSSSNETNAQRWWHRQQQFRLSTNQECRVHYIWSRSISNSTRYFSLWPVYYCCLQRRCAPMLHTLHRAKRKD